MELKNEFKIREYKTEDKYQIINLLRLNSPKYFALEEETDLIYYLNNEIEIYYVVELDATIIGSGGINFTENNTIAKISWDILHPKYQGKSIGAQLLKHRIDRLKLDENLKKIVVRTSQLAYKFYEKQGFYLVEVKKDYWAKDFDMYVMEYH
jgi:ribosomal protein S18 acetylase RimI-like enzyme